MLIALAILLAFVFIQMLVGYAISGPVYRGPASDHFDGRKFFTPGGRQAKGFLDVIRWMSGRKRGPWRRQLNPGFGEKPISQVRNGVRVTFVNHSTFLIQLEGLNFLTDPVWSERVSPFSWAGPKRMRPPGIRFEDLPKIDVVLLSHNHYDHLDIATLRRIYSVHRPVFVTALGVGAFLRKSGIVSIDLDWWQEHSIGSLKIQSVPAQHFSGRGLFDRDGTLWCGFVIRSADGNIYFAGDSGYNPSMFREIGKRCADIKLAIIPIGAYKPEWFMSPIHCSPAEAVQIHRDVASKQSIASHFGTFPLADDGESEPAESLTQALGDQGVDADRFILLPEGQARSF